MSCGVNMNGCNYCKFGLKNETLTTYGKLSRTKESAEIYVKERGFVMMNTTGNLCKKKTRQER